MSRGGEVGSDQVLADQEIRAWFDSASIPTRMPLAASAFDGDLFGADVLDLHVAHAPVPDDGDLDTSLFDADVNAYLDAQHADHSARLYETDQELAETVAAFLEHALSDGDLVGLVVTPYQRMLLANALPAGMFDREIRQGRLVVGDAHETLALFYRDGVVDVELFESRVATPFRRVARDSSWVSVYGEMAPMLWSAGDVVGALVLEQLWTDLQAEMPFSLLCAYPASAVSDEPAGLHELCHSHTAVHTH